MGGSCGLQQSSVLVGRALNDAQSLSCPSIEWRDVDHPGRTDQDI